MTQIFCFNSLPPHSRPTRGMLPKSLLLFFILGSSLSILCCGGAPTSHGIPTESSPTNQMGTHEDILGTTDDARPNEIKFMSWLKKCGATLECLTIKNTILDGFSQYGVFVNSELEEFSEVARIPLSCSISVSAALEHPDLQEIWATHPSITSGRSPMAIQLLWERNKGENSAIADWIRLLPKDLDLPVMWSRKERQELKGTFTLDRTLSDLEGLLDDYEKVFVNALFVSHPETFNEETYSFDDYVWAWAIIWSRNVEQRVAGEWEAFLVPFVDMMNHDSDKGADVYVNFGKTDLIVRLNGSFAPGQELKRTYIPFGPNIDLFRMYGFIDPVNSHIASALKFDFDTQDQNYQRRISWAKKYRIDITTEYPYNSLYITNHGIPPNIPAMLRIAHYNFEMRDAWTSLRHAPDPYKTVENKVEESFFTFLRENLQKRMKEFTTSIEEDENILASNPKLSRRYQLAVELRLEEKIAIQGSLDSLTATTVRFDQPINLGRQRTVVYPKRAANRNTK